MKSLPLSGIPASLLSKDEFVHNKDERRRRVFNVHHIRKMKVY